MNDIKDLNNTKKIKKIKTTSWVAFIFVIIITIVLISGVLLVKELIAPYNELVRRTESPDGKYTVESYVSNANSTSNWVTKCYLKTDGKSGKKLIYTDNKTKNPNVIWLDNNLVWIDGHEIELPNGKYDYKNNN